MLQCRQCAPHLSKISDISARQSLTTEEEIYRTSAVMEPGEEGLLHLSVLLLGGPQSGKSATGNTLLGSWEFASRLSPGAVTRECRLCRRTFPEFLRRQGSEVSLRLQVLDTPAYPSSLLGSEQVREGIVRSVEQALDPGPHVVALVRRADVPFGDEDCQLIQLAEDLLGPAWRSHTLLVLSHLDCLNRAGISEEEYLRQAPGPLRALLESLENRHHFVDTSTPWLQTERRPLLEKLIGITRHNKYKALELR